MFIMETSILEKMYMSEGRYGWENNCKPSASCFLMNHFIFLLQQPLGWSYQPFYGEIEIQKWLLTWSGSHSRSEADSSQSSCFQLKQCLGDPICYLCEKTTNLDVCRHSLFK